MLPSLILSVSHNNAQEAEQLTLHNVHVRGAVQKMNREALKEFWLPARNHL